MAINQEKLEQLQKVVQFAMRQQYLSDMMLPPDQSGSGDDYKQTSGQGRKVLWRMLIDAEDNLTYLPLDDTAIGEFVLSLVSD